MSVVCIIQARLGSTRLPRKVLEPIGPFSMLEHCVRRASRAELVDKVVVAIPLKDKELWDYCTDRHWDCYPSGGSEADVLRRYYLAAKVYKATTVVRVTSDCPLIDPGVIDIVVNRKLQEGPKGETPDFVAMDIEKPTFPHGLEVEAFSFKALRQAHFLADAPHDREHVTGWIRSHPDDFTLGHVGLDKDWSRLSVTVDVQSDLDRVRDIVDKFGPDVTTREWVTYLEGRA